MPFNFLRREDSSKQGSDKEISEPIATSQQPRRGSKEVEALVPVFEDKLEIEESEDDLELACELFFSEKFKQAAILLQQCSEGKDCNPIAWAMLGFCFEFGMGVKQDFIMAEKYYITAGSKGNGLAYCRLAFLRYYGRPNVVIDRAQAEEWKVKALELGSEATEWLSIAANKYKIAAANYAYGVCFHDG